MAQGSLLPQAHAKKEGFDNVLYLDAKEGQYLEEVHSPGPLRPALSTKTLNPAGNPCPPKPYTVNLDSKEGQCQQDVRPPSPISSSLPVQLPPN